MEKNRRHVRLGREGVAGARKDVAFARRQRTWFRSDAFGDEQLDVDAAADPLPVAIGAAERFIAAERLS